MNNVCRGCGIKHNDEQGFARDLCNHCLFMLYPGEYQGDLPMLDKLDREIAVARLVRAAARAGL